MKPGDVGVMRCLRLFSMAVLLSAWSCSAVPPSPDEVAGRAAKLYYDYLVEGKYEAYVDGFYQPDSIPASYREQLVANARMFAGRQREERGGIAEVRLLRASADTARHVGRAFLLFCYADSTKEEVVVPMVEHRGVWMMR